ncbi:MAG: acyl-CoA dehydrogenase family protein [Deltaproteobacteria bacterium]|nr:acyl-CoA dehydrogenase family protein [Deltaproteobacteria bacterium]
MDFDLTAEQQLLGDTVQRFLAKEYAFEARRRILRSPEGWSRAVWGRLAELGLLGLQVPEAHGGMAPAPVETLLTMTALGRALCLEPYLSSAVLGTALLAAQASPAQQAALLPAMAAGERLAVPAHGEPGARYDLSRVSTRAAREGGGWRLRGKKAVVLHAPAADHLLVSARTSGGEADEAGLSLFLVPREAGGVKLLSYRTIDGQVAADVELDAALPGDALLGGEGTAFAAISSAWDRGLAALCAEAVGVLQATLDATIEYTKTRRQFGVPIAKFQALQHRMADMLIHVEQARSMGYLAALRAGEPDARERRRALSAAKVVVGQACRFVGQQAVQLHGGMGVTDELAVSHCFKRLLAIELSLGDTDHHVERFIAASVGGA